MSRRLNADERKLLAAKLINTDEHAEEVAQKLFCDSNITIDEGDRIEFMEEQNLFECTECGMWFPLRKQSRTPDMCHDCRAEFNEHDDKVRSRDEEDDWQGE